MLSKRNCDHYADAIASKYGITKKTARMFLHYVMRNFVKRIEKGEDVRIPGFGTFYFDKRKQVHYMQSSKRAAERSALILKGKLKAKKNYGK
ncbi:MAG: HU family DNA-binding protein [Ilumatobacteraceae bacterium]